MKLCLSNNCSILNYLFSAFSVNNLPNKLLFFQTTFHIWILPVGSYLGFFLLEFQLLKTSHIFFILLKTTVTLYYFLNQWWKHMQYNQSSQLQIHITQFSLHIIPIHLAGKSISPTPTASDDIH